MRHLGVVTLLLGLALSGSACRTDFSVDAPDGSAVTCDEAGVCAPPGEGPLDGSISSGGDAGPATPTDAGADGSKGPPYADGAACSKPADCTSTICADSAILGWAFAKTGAVCSTPCCTSEQCGAGLVCVGTGTGGHYCLPAAALGRTVGAAPGGHACTVGSACRAGVCVGNVCADSCCADAQCGTAKCKPVDVESNGHESYACSVTGGSTTMCSGAVDSCASGVCASMSCSPPCCGQSTVPLPGTPICDTQALSNGDTFNFGNTGTTGAGAMGAGCSLGTACQSGRCDKADGAMGGVCSDACCVDADCPASFRCLPRSGLTHYLRCVKP